MDAVKRSPILEEAIVLSENLSIISGFGLEALNYRAGKKPPLQWKTNSLKATQKARQQGGRCDLQVVSAIEELIQSVSGKE